MTEPSEDTTRTLIAGGVFLIAVLGVVGWQLWSPGNGDGPPGVPTPVKNGTHGSKGGVKEPDKEGPKTDPSKSSKAGIQAVVEENGRYLTVPAEALGSRDNLLKPVWRDGELLVDHSFAEIRERAAGA